MSSSIYEKDPRSCIDNTEMQPSTETCDPEPYPDIFTTRKRDLAHFKHPLANIRNEYIFLAIGFLALSVSRWITHVMLLHYFSTPLFVYALFNIGKCAFFAYQTHFQPHPYYDYPDPKCGMPKDPGGEQILRTGLPYVVDRKSKVRILEEGRDEFSLIEFIYAPHKLPFMDKLGSWLTNVVGICQPRFAEILTYLYYDSRLSRYSIRGFIEEFKIDMTQYQIPEGGYKTFQQFFTRHAKPGHRPTEGKENEMVIVSPVDCRGLFYYDATFLESIDIKNQRFSLNELIGEDLVKQGWNANNTAFGLLRLNKMDYHRYHAPCDSRIKEVWTFGDKVHMIHGCGNLLGIGLLQENRRKVVLLDKCYKNRQCIYIPIGASRVGSCIITKSKEECVNKGEEIGHFAFGGSTVCVLFRNDEIQWDKDLVNYTKQNIEVKILQGQKVAVWKS